MQQSTYMQKFAAARQSIAVGLFLIGTLVFSSNLSAACHDLLDFTATKLRSSEKIDFCDAFAGKALLVVNTASQCGFTSQFSGLEKLYQDHRRTLAIVGFPSNDFNQEHADSKKVADVCYVNYGVTFTMLEPSAVRGDSANEVFRKLADRTGQQPQWNFNKYLVSADGSQIMHFPSSVKPNSDRLSAAIERVKNR